ncbi:MAG: RidA family protein [Polaromonas sp.]|nr:RidA family protein [Polaromonas sp.]
MNATHIIIPPTMANIHDELGYAPAVRVGDLLLCSGQVGRTAELEVVADPAAQFETCWDNVETVLAAAGCTLADVVDLTTFHVDMHTHYALFKQIKNRRFPPRLSAWTAIGVQCLSRPGLLVEIKCLARVPAGR